MRCALARRVSCAGSGSYYGRGVERQCWLRLKTLSAGRESAGGRMDGELGMGMGMGMGMLQVAT